jgi:hypothetical protein
MGVGKTTNVLDELVGNIVLRKQRILVGVASIVGTIVTAKPTRYYSHPSARWHSAKITTVTW